jgi:hypothetical protein
MFRRVWVREGVATERLAATIDEERLDAIAMTTHGRTGLARAFLGSVAESVLARVQAPMLVLRNAELRASIPQPHPESRHVGVT